MALRMWASSAANALKLSAGGGGARAAAAGPAFSISRFFSTVHDGLKYTQSHEWVKTTGDVATGHLGEVVFVELPEPGTKVAAGGPFGNVESVKATSDVNSPISGEVVEVNAKLSETPGLINTSPYEDGWMIKVKPSSPGEADALLDAAKYTKHCEEEDAH
ncbi:Glycine cleavage system H protein, mitochondrial [Zea mays]|uniref:Glycine cleavage system H protein n=1 Tax=Zea mays TaxID=4577 RepID=A0A3L6GCI9_MAIZE|nr:Glycine cleavage system H protein, mitochondrial [Zea mays]